eukprot:EG_transcript_7623
MTEVGRQSALWKVINLFVGTDVDCPSFHPPAPAPTPEPMPSPCEAVCEEQNSRILAEADEFSEGHSQESVRCSLAMARANRRRTTFTAPNSTLSRLEAELRELQGANAVAMDKRRSVRFMAAPQPPPVALSPPTPLSAALPMDLDVQPSPSMQAACLERPGAAAAAPYRAASEGHAAAEVPRHAESPPSTTWPPHGPSVAPTPSPGQASTAASDRRPSVGSTEDGPYPKVRKLFAGAAASARGGPAPPVPRCPPPRVDPKAAARPARQSTFARLAKPRSPLVRRPGPPKPVWRVTGRASSASSSGSSAVLRRTTAGPAARPSSGPTPAAGATGLKRARGGDGKSRSRATTAGVYPPRPSTASAPQPRAGARPPPPPPTAPSASKAASRHPAVPLRQRSVNTPVGGGTALRQLQAENAAVKAQNAAVHAQNAALQQQLAALAAELGRARGQGPPAL